MTDPERPIIGHHAGWGMVGAAYRPVPHTLPAGGVDTMQVRVREKIDVYGVGTDVIHMTGTFVVRRESPKPVRQDVEMAFPQAIIDAEFRALDLTGESPVFGVVNAGLDPEQTSAAEVRPPEQPAEVRVTSAKCKAELQPVIDLPQLGLTLKTAEPVPLASNVVQIPPVGDVARSEKAVPLVDEDGNLMGELVSADIEVGEVIHRTTPTTPAPQPPERAT
jgi:Family of unknown function (DUF6073)